MRSRLVVFGILFLIGFSVIYVATAQDSNCSLEDWPNPTFGEGSVVLNSNPDEADAVCLGGVWQPQFHTQQNQVMRETGFTFEDLNVRVVGESHEFVENEIGEVRRELVEVTVGITGEFSFLGQSCGFVADWQLFDNQTQAGIRWSNFDPVVSDGMYIYGTFTTVEDEVFVDVIFDCPYLGELQSYMN